MQLRVQIYYDGGKVTRRKALMLAFLMFSSLAFAGECSGDSPPGETLVVAGEQSSEEIGRCDRPCGSYLANIYGDEPCARATYHRLNYAILGADDGKMQLSLKYRLIKDFDLYLGVNALLLWDVYEDSNPLRDLDFIPEVFYRFDFRNRWLLSADVGYLHASNGKAEEESRSWDRLQLRFNTHTNTDPIDIIWITSFYVDTRSGHNNTDIEKYYGFWDTTLIFRKLLGGEAENLDLDLHLVSGRHGEPFNKGSLTVGAKYNLPGERFNPYLYAQYFAGYTETLLDYDKRNEEVRAGVAFYY